MSANNYGPLTSRFSCLISTYSRSPLRVQCRLMRLPSGHVTLLEANFNPLNCLPSRTYGPGRPHHVGLCPKFLLEHFFYIYEMFIFCFYQRLVKHLINLFLPQAIVIIISHETRLSKVQRSSLAHQQTVKHL